MKLARFFVFVVQSIGECYSPEKPDGRAVDCKPIVDVCLQVGSIPASGMVLAGSMLVTGNRSVSKTEDSGSTPDTVVK